jgi:galactonate dehydratase
MTLARPVGHVRRWFAARQEQGDVDLMIEFHRKLTPLTALTVIEALREFNIVFFEDPIQIDSIQSQAEIARLTLPVAQGERSIPSGSSASCFNPAVRSTSGRPGWPGLTHCKKIAALAESFHCAVVTHNYRRRCDGGPVHLDACIPNFIVQSTRNPTRQTRCSDRATA